MDEETLRRLAGELLRRQPAVFADVVNGELPIMMDHMEEPDQEPEPPNNLNQPVWCKCGLCVIMPNLGREQMLHTNSLAMFEYKPTFYSTCFGWQCVGFGNVLQGGHVGDVTSS